MTALVIRKCCIKSLGSSSFPMVYATIEDLDHNTQFEVSEWLEDDTHVDRTHSCIEENEQINLLEMELKEVLDLLDISLQELKREESERSDSWLELFWC